MNDNIQVTNEVINTKNKERKMGIITIILWIAIYIGLSVVIGLISSYLRGLSPDAISGAEASAQYNPLLMLTIPSIILVVLFVVRYFEIIKEDIKRLTKKDFVIIVVFTIATLILNYASSALLEYFGFVAANQEVFEEGALANIIPAAFIAVVYGPIVEEILFRKALNQSIPNKIVFTILSVALFGLMHSADITIITYLTLGLMFTLTYLLTRKNLVASAIVHLINNLIGIIAIIIEMN